MIHSSLNLHQHPAGWDGRPRRLEIISREKPTPLVVKGKPGPLSWPAIPAVFLQVVELKGYDDKRDDYYAIELTPDEAIKVANNLLLAATAAAAVIF